MAHDRRHSGRRICCSLLLSILAQIIKACYLQILGSSESGKRLEDIVPDLIASHMAGQATVTHARTIVGVQHYQQQYIMRQRECPNISIWSWTIMCIFAEDICCFAD
jgi:hypothetical protein